MEFYRSASMEHPQGAAFHRERRALPRCGYRARAFFVGAGTATGLRGAAFAGLRFSSPFAAAFAGAAAEAFAPLFRGVARLAFNASMRSMTCARGCSGADD